MAYEILDSRDREELENTKANLELKKISFGIAYANNFKDGMHVYELVDITTGTFGLQGEIELYFAGGAMIMGGPIEEERHKFSIGRKYYIEGQYEEVYETVIPSAIYDIIDLKDKANIEDIGSRVLLDVTLTEEQAGGNSVKVAIPNHELLQKAKQWNIRLMHPYIEAINANTAWYNCNIVSGKSGIGGITLANGYNTAFSSSSNKAFWYITAFNTQHATREGASGSVISYYQPVTPWAEQSSANSGTNAKTNLYCYSSMLFAEDNTVYLEFSGPSDFVFEAGTKLYLEVVL